MENKKSLNIGERLVAMGLLPKAGNYSMLRMLNELNGKLGPSADEMHKYEIKPVLDKEGKDTGKVGWNSLGVTESVDIEFKFVELKLIHDALVQLDKDSKLEFHHLSLYEKFVGEEGDENGKTEKK